MEKNKNEGAGKPALIVIVTSAVLGIASSICQVADFILRSLHLR